MNPLTKINSRLRRWPLLRRIYFNLFTGRYLWARLSPRASFAQDSEDIKIAEMLQDVRFFVDIGAYDGITDSNTFLFALRGARGICFEPVRETFVKLTALYRFNRRVICRCCAVSDTTRQGTITKMRGLSCIPETEDRSHSLHYPVLAARTECEPIQLMTFAEAAASIAIPNPVDLLSIDVEGHELSVLQSIPLERLRFRMIVIESHLRDRATNELLWRHRDWDAMNGLLNAHGYHPIWENWVNTFYAPCPEADTSLRHEIQAVDYRSVPAGRTTHELCR